MGRFPAHADLYSMGNKLPILFMKACRLSSTLFPFLIFSFLFY